MTPSALRWTWPDSGLLRRVALGMVFTILFASGLLKAVSPDWMMGLAEGWSIAIGMLEIASALILLSQWSSIGLVAAIVIATSGIAWSVFQPGRRCGCLGKLVTVTSPQHVVLASVLGFWACIVLWLSGTAARERK